MAPRGLQTIKKRRDFLAARTLRHGTPGLVLQARDRGDYGPIRIGITCSRKIGNAVARNRAKRRLREVARIVALGAGRAGWDYVLIGRAEATIERPFLLLQDDLCRAMARIHRG